MLEAVFFDLDGTLADTAPDLAAALNAVRMARGHAAMPLAALRPLTSQGARGLLRAGFGIGPEHADYAALQEQFLDCYAAAICVHTTLFPGMAAVLEHLERAAIPWGVVTNKHSRYTQPLLEALGLARRAVCIVSGDSAAQPKPAADPLLLACAQTGTAPHRCLYVGDDERDVRAGKAAGMPVVAAAYGYLGERADPLAWQAEHLVQQPSDLIPLLEQLNFSRRPDYNRP